MTDTLRYDLAKDRQHQLLRESDQRRHARLAAGPRRRMWTRITIQG